MAKSSAQHIKYLTLIVLMLQSITASPTKTNARPVFEVINEQPIDRIDDFKTSNVPSNLPYGNPLAGNSQQNARLHAQNQQAMFNAERVRQHRAQLQRWASIPRPMDSYMRAYHESQESHQLELEKQQANIRNKKQSTVENQQKSRQSQNNQERTLRRGVKVVPETIKLTKADAVLKTEKSRNHRSYGSVENHQYLQPKMYKTIYISPAPTYDQGVTIKPNGNNGLDDQENSKLYTEAAPSKTHYVYPKQYSQMQNYESAQDIVALNSLLNKNPHDQLSELNALITSSRYTNETPKELDGPIDLYFYMKDPHAQTLTEYNEHTLYGQIPPTYASAYTNAVKDHTPITEEVDDIEDPNKNVKVQSHGVYNVVSTQQPDIETTTVKSNNYYKVEVASQTITSGYKPSDAKVQYYLKDQENEKPQALAHVKPLKYYKHNEVNDGDQSERYLHHNAQHTGIQHLSEDGTGVSAYGENNLHYAANYEFGYRVRDHHSGNDFGHAEAKHGEATNGHYHVLLPDGRMQKVKYSAGPSGFHADITYDHLH
ncbi:cuticular protein RR-2 motif 143 [Aphomia sociella]